MVSDLTTDIPNVETEIENTNEPEHKDRNSYKFKEKSSRIMILSCLLKRVVNPIPHVIITIYLFDIRYEKASKKVNYTLFIL